MKNRIAAYIWQVRWNLALRRTRVSVCKAMATQLDADSPRLAEAFRLLGALVP